MKTAIPIVSAGTKHVNLAEAQELRVNLGLNIPMDAEIAKYCRDSNY